MATEKGPAFPRRDDEGRVISLSELMVVAVAGTLIALAALALIDGVLALLGISSFGQASGWLGIILPGLIYFDDQRAWRGRTARFLVVAVAAGVGIGLGLILASLLKDGLPPLASGGAGALLAAVVYAFVWFVGIRWLTGEMRRT